MSGTGRAIARRFWDYGAACEFGFLRLRRQIGNDGEVFDEALPGQNKLGIGLPRGIDEDETSDVVEVARIARAAIRYACVGLCA